MHIFYTNRKGKGKQRRVDTNRIQERRKSKLKQRMDIDKKKSKRK